MKTNFSIVSFIEIEFEGIELDLHNNFDFLSEKIEINENSVSLHFQKSKGSWATNTPFDHLHFVLENYNFLKQIEPNTEWLEDDCCLAGITFFDADFREEDEGLMDRRVPNEDDDIIFSFESGRIIRVNCEDVMLKAAIKIDDTVS